MLTDIKWLNMLWYTIISLGNYSNYCKDFWKNSIVTGYKSQSRILTWPLVLVQLQNTV